MLITKEVEIELYNDIKYYESLGYPIPRVTNKWGHSAVPKGTKIIIKVEHLLKNSEIRVDCICDGISCGKLLNIFWCNYLKTNKDGKTYCQTCAQRLYGSKNANKTKLIKSIDFEKWCIENDKEFAIYLWSDNNIYKVNECSYGSTIFIEWECENSLHENYSRTISGAIKCDFRCPSCVQERNESILQEKVRLYLLFLKSNFDSTLNIVREYDKDSLICINEFTNQKLPYDNEVFNDYFKLIIETQGIQHYEVTNFHVMKARRKGIVPEQELSYVQWKDEYKKQYALSQGYYYLAIPYWADNDSEDWKTLIDNKLEEIYNDINISQQNYDS